MNTFVPKLPKDSIYIRKKKNLEMQGGRRKNPRAEDVLHPVLKEIVTRVSGENGVAVIAALSGKELTDEELAERIGVRVNLVRRILYDLYENRVVNYRRLRDENSGWYVYYWRVEADRASEHFQTIQNQLLKKLEEKLEYERNTMFFTCGNGCPKLPFEQAVEADFKCPHCGDRLEHLNNSAVIASLESQVGLLRKNFS